MVNSSDTPHLPRSAPIEAYGNGGFRFDSMSHRGSLLCLPDSIWAWPVTTPAEIDRYALQRVFDQANSIDTLLIGTGTEIWLPPNRLREALRAVHVGVDAMMTGPAIRTVSRLFGLFANIAVGINVAMIFGVLSLLNATLTLPGIAGIVLTVGIAVDSNVLIYERIREEIRGGRNAISAIDAGFTRALATIMDSNITTFIAAAVLFYIGTGPVRGFAVTLGIGILTTVFTAFTVTRLIVAAWVRWKRPQSVPI